MSRGIKSGKPPTIEAEHHGHKERLVVVLMDWCQCRKCAVDIIVEASRETHPENSF